MTVATWLPNHAYSLNALANPTVSNGHSFICTAAGTSAATEPAWSGRYPAVTDNSAAWAPYTVLSPATLLAQLNLTSTTGQYGTTIIGNYLLDAISSLEQATRRFLVNRPNFTIQMTSQGRPILPIPGIRTATSVTWQGAVQTAGTPGGAGSGYMLLPDVMQSGTYTSVQFRPLPISEGGPWWLSLGGSSTNWFDTSADSPWDPRNYAAGIIFTSTGLDSVIVGDWGWEPNFEPGEFIHALGILAGWYVMRPPSILADSAITPAGGIVSYSQMPAEVQQFTKAWSGGSQVVTIG